MGDLLQKLIVAIPAYNEQTTLSSVIGRIRKSLVGEIDFLILVVDDGSTDNTVDVAINSDVDIVVAHPQNVGVAAAYRTAIQYALKFNADIICTIDADGQFNPDEVIDLLEPIRNGHADVVVGSRFKESIIRNKSIPIMNRITNKLAAGVVSIFCGQRLTDVESGFRAISKRAASQLNLLGRVSFSHDMLLDMLWKGFKLVEVPVGVRYFKNRKSRVIGSFLIYGFRSLGSIILKIAALKGVLRDASNKVIIAEVVYDRTS